MKKLLSFLLVLAVCMSLSACDLDAAPKKETASSSSQTNETTETNEQKFGLNETAVFDELKFTATELKESNGTDFFEPENGNVFVGVKFTIENISNEEQSVSTILLFEGYVDDIKCDYSINASCAFDEGTLDGSVSAGKKLVGWYALEVPKNWKTIELQVQSDWLSNSSAKFVFNK